MTTQEAIKDIVETGIELGAGDYVGLESLNMAVEALEKQVPKKPIIGDTFTSKFQESIIKTGKYTDIARYQSYKCPVCQESIIMLWEAERNEKMYGCKCKDNFCKKCGQAFDWSD